MPDLPVLAAGVRGWVRLLFQRDPKINKGLIMLTFWETSAPGLLLGPERTVRTHGAGVGASRFLPSCKLASVNA
jgi:hypothetical protein